MNQDFIFTENKKVVMTSERIVTTVTKILESVDACGCKRLVDIKQTRNVSACKPYARRAA